MESVKLFSESELPRRRRAKALWLVAGLASILPGGGHFALGKTQEGARLLVACLLLASVSGVAAYLQWEQPSWLLLRASFVVYLYGVVDACLRNYELVDGRDNGRVRPRLVALLNLTLYGAGYWLLELPALAAIAAAGGVVLHGWLAAQNVFLRLMMELALLVVAWHAHRVATERLPKPEPTGVGQRPRRRDTSPGWLMAALSGFVVLNVGSLVFILHASHELDAAMRVDQSQALTVEPYYRNAAYGVQVELNAPGWSFTAAAPDEFLRARHITRDAEFSLRSAPRVFGLPTPRLQAEAALAQLQLSGLVLGPSSEEPATLAGLKGVRVLAEGMRGNRRRKVEILAAGKGWRNYVLSYEWGADNARFGKVELDYLLAKMDLSGSRPARDTAR